MSAILALPRFWSKVMEAPSGCWEWIAGRTGDGYAAFKWNGVNVTGHRLTYRDFVGDVPDGLQLDHLCRVRHCVNPYHLEVVPQRINTLRGEGPTADHARRASCGKPGHGPYKERVFKGSTRRVCSDCEADATARCRARKRGLTATS